jgi:hypothetical protein
LPLVTRNTVAIFELCDECALTLMICYPRNDPALGRCDRYCHKRPGNYTVWLSTPERVELFAQLRG